VSLGDDAGDYTNSFGGTSSACPGVAGVAALVLAGNPDLRWDEVKDVLGQSCDRIDAGQDEYDGDGHSDRYGFGRVNAATAVSLAGSRRSAPTAAHTGAGPATA
jgi:subtilisin family serine protease